MLAQLVIAEPKFPLGKIVITANAQGKLDPSAVQHGLERHAIGDWGTLCDADRQENELSLEQGFRLMSVYGEGSGRFWIITEADRSVTTVLLPEDY